MDRRLAPRRAAWTDYGWTGPDGVTDYGGEQIQNVSDLDIVTIEAPLEVLDRR